MKLIKFILAVFGIFIVLGMLSSMFKGCGSSGKYEKTPVDILIKDMSETERFSIILYDMNVEGTFINDYNHKYQVIVDDEGDINKTETQWHEVSKNFFMKHKDHMGMVIASKSPEEGVVKKVSPPGYDNYVGNDKYGRWRTNNDGSSFWEFYGKYAMLSSLFNMGTNPVRRSYYSDYRDRYSSGRAYYGPKQNGSRLYGTSGRFTKNYNPRSSWRTKASNQSFRQKVRNRVSTSKTSKRGGRYSSSSFRSRSSGFGK